jgi:hypothetical protein
MLAVTVALLATLLWRGGLSRGVASLFLVAFVAYTTLQYFGVARVFD